MKTVLITGADRGLGYALAERFLEEGYTVYAGQFMPEWKQLSELKKIWKDRLESLVLDVSSQKSVDSMAKKLSGQIGTLDVLVNNAGIVKKERDISDQIEEKGIVQEFRVNALGALLVTRAVLPLMQNGEKRLCFVSSEAGSIGDAHRTEMYGYCMSKAALNMVVRLLHNELYPKGYRFRIFHPGWVRSYIADEERKQGILEPEESAKAAVYQFLGDNPCEHILKIKDVDDNVWSF